MMEKNNIEANETVVRSKKDKKNSAKNEKIKKEKIRHEKSVKTINRQIYIMGTIFIVAFIAMAVNIGVYIETQSKDTINNPYNKRSDVLEQTIHRGDILSKDNEVLACTIDNDDGTFYRNYPYGALFSHVVGSYDKGKTGLELYENYTMLEYDESVSQIIKSDLTGKKIKGNSIVTTLDTKLTQVCYDALGEYTGAVIVSNPKTGQILAMVSKPDYDPNTVAKDWEEINSASVSKLLNRATQGLYAPGSTFKVVTMLEYLRENGLDYSLYEYNCKGSDSFEGASISCYHKEKHGKIGLPESISHSCNSSFGNIGVGLSNDGFRDITDRLLFNRQLNIKDFAISKSVFNLGDNATLEEKIQASIGQGTTLVTPLQNLMIISSIANEGKIMTPYLVDHIIKSDGTVVKETSPTVLQEAMTVEEANTVKDLLKGVCKYGTAKELSSLSYECSGKTGSAEFAGSDLSHAWFIGFAPSDDPKIAVSVIVEGEGTGSKFAVPIAKKIFESYLGN